MNLQITQVSETAPVDCIRILKGLSWASMVVNNIEVEIFMGAMRSILKLEDR